MFGRCKHLATETTTRIGRDPAPFVNVVTRCKNCGERVPPKQSLTLSGDEVSRLLRRAEALPDGVDEIVQ